MKRLQLDLVAAQEDVARLTLGIRQAKADYKEPGDDRGQYKVRGKGAGRPDANFVVPELTHTVTINNHK